MQTQKHYSLVWLSLSKNLFPKVSIIRNQDSIFEKCLLDNIIVIKPTRFLIDGKDIMLSLS